MNPLTYQQMAARTECDQEASRHRMAGGSMFLAPGTGTLDRLLPVRLNHAAMGITKEGGELLELVQDFIYYGKPLDRQAVLIEAGDVLWHVAQLLNVMGLTFEQVFDANIAKLQKRYPHKYSSECAERGNRDTDGEAQAAAVATAGPLSIEGAVRAASEAVLAHGGLGVPTPASRDQSHPSHTWSDTAPKRCKHCGAYKNLNSGTHPCPRRSIEDMPLPAHGRVPHRLVSEVVKARTVGAVMGGCCDRFADNQACDCLELAVPDDRACRLCNGRGAVTCDWSVQPSQCDRCGGTGLEPVPASKE